MEPVGERKIEESTVQSIVEQRLQGFVATERGFRSALDYFRANSGNVLEHHRSNTSEEFCEWIAGRISFLPSTTESGKNFIVEKLCETITAAKDTTQEQYFARIRAKVCGEVVRNVGWNVADKVKEYSTDARSWKVGEKHDVASLDAYMRELAKLKSEPTKDKAPEYAAFTGSSGSGKTTAMIYSVINDIDADSKLKVYLQCGGTKSSPTEFLLGKKPLFHETLQNALNKATDYQGISIPSDFWKGTTLVLILDEVPQNWEHNDYMKLSQTLRDLFSGAVLFVGSTALSVTVLQQPTTPTSVVKVRMLTVKDPEAKELLKRRLGNSDHCENWFAAFSLLPALLTNQRCAELTSNVLKPIIASVAEKTPSKKAIEQFASMSAFVILNVAQTYLSMNGIQRLVYGKRIGLMAASLGLVSMQRAVKPKVDGSVERLTDDVYNKLAEGDRIAVSTKGLVDREMVGEGNSFLEWTMSPALTLVCAVSVAPWFAELHHESDKLEALGCLQWLSIRYIQTGDVWELKRMEHGVPRTGNDQKCYEIAKDTQGKIFLNAPLAAIGDCLVAGAPRPVIPPAFLSTRTAMDSRTPPRNSAENLTQQKDGKGSSGPSGKGSAGTANSLPTMFRNSPHTAQTKGDKLRSAKIVQAKHTIGTEPTCDVVEEMAKAGLYDEAAKAGNKKLELLRKELRNLKTQPKRRKGNEPEDRGKQVEKQESRISSQETKMKLYLALNKTGRRLIADEFKDASMVFLTNAKFSEKDLVLIKSLGCLAVQGERNLKFGEPAWQSFYPFAQLSFKKSSATKTGRREVGEISLP